MMHICEDAINCYGCGNCSLICPCQAISMGMSRKGFYIPLIDMEKCIHCGKCEKICPVISKPIGREGMFDCQQIDQSGKVGRKAIAFKRKNKRRRLECQSGGAFSAIANLFFSKYGNAVVYGAALNEASMDVKYIRIDAPDDIKKLAGSKYAQAEMSGIPKKVERDLREGRWVLFSGTPCHVAAVRKYLEDRKTDSVRLLLVDFMCHGVLSQKMFLEYIDYLEKKLGDRVIRFCFRDKRIHGWGGMYSTFGTAGHGEYMTGGYLDLFQLDLFQLDLCYLCRYASLERVSDITIGDYWNIGFVNKRFYDSAGVSCIITNSELGNSIIEDIENYGAVLETSLQDACQRPLLEPLRVPDGKNPEDYWSCYFREGIDGILRDKKWTRVIAGIPMSNDRKVVAGFIKGWLNHSALVCFLRNKL